MIRWGISFLITLYKNNMGKYSTLHDFRIILRLFFFKWSLRGYGFVGTGQKSKNSQLLAHSISAHLSAPCLSLCPPNKLMSGRGPEVKLGEGVRRDPQPHRPGPETGTRPAKGKTRNGTRLRSNTGVECLGRWSSFAATCKKKKAGGNESLKRW